MLHKAIRHKGMLHRVILRKGVDISKVSNTITISQASILTGIISLWQPILLRCNTALQDRRQLLRDLLLHLPPDWLLRGLNVQPPVPGLASLAHLRVGFRRAPANTRRIKPVGLEMNYLREP
jgi:hypothetical protein